MVVSFFFFFVALCVSPELSLPPPLRLCQCALLANCGLHWGEKVGEFGSKVVGRVKNIPSRKRELDLTEWNGEVSFEKGS